MKTKIKLCLLLMICGIFFSFNDESSQIAQDNRNIIVKASKDEYPQLPGYEKTPEGPDLQKYYFDDWNRTEGLKELTPDFLNKTWNQIYSLPDENDLIQSDAINQWRLIGPYGSSSNVNSGKFSGRVKCIEVGNSANPIIASASGGLWSFVFVFPYCLSENVSSLACGAFATYPGNANIILLGTGEPYVTVGTGMFRTTNGGTIWNKIILDDDPNSFYKIEYQNLNPLIVNAASSAGFMRSTNAGLNWTTTLTGNVTDFVVNNSNPTIMYCARDGQGIYKSINSGVNWIKMTTPGIPTSNVGRTALGIGVSNPSKVYAGIAKDSDNEMLGVYITTNDGGSWTNVSPPQNIYGDQGWWDNTIGVCPTNSNIVLAGGVRLWRSINSGSTWTEIGDENVHADQQCMEWTSDGSTVYVGNDGGVSVSTDQGATFNNGINFLPITQYVNFDVGVSNRGVIYGGSQDNGLTGTTDGGSTWLYTKKGDGGGVAIDPNSSLYIYSTAGAYSGNWKFWRFKSTDKGLTWDTNHAGIEPSTSWYTKMRSDRQHPVDLYTNSGNYVYKSDDGEVWTKLNVSSFGFEVKNINVSKRSGAGAVIYASLDNPNNPKLMVYDNGSFVERSAGLPSGTIRGVAPHITNRDKAYALMNGFVNGNKVYKTTNRGINWTNISGNLPNVPMGDLVPHPNNDNLLYLGTQMGCYRTTNAGVNWFRWNNAMPDGARVTEMKWIDSTLDNGKFYIVAGTYGNSIWTRDISGDDDYNTLTLTCHMQGFYNPQTNFMIQDTVRVYLREPFSPFAIVDSAKVRLTVAGAGQLTFYKSSTGVPYYLQVVHRNSIQTWSKNPVSFSNYDLTYDFSNLSTQAYGNNMAFIDNSPSTYGFYSGDINRDNTVDVSDIVLAYNDAIDFESGYVQSDVTGDNFVDVSDMVLCFNNSNEFVQAITP